MADPAAGKRNYSNAADGSRDRDMFCSHGDRFCRAISVGITAIESPACGRVERDAGVCWSAGARWVLPGNTLRFSMESSRDEGFRADGCRGVFVVRQWHAGATAKQAWVSLVVEYFDHCGIRSWHCTHGRSGSRRLQSHQANVRND